MVHSFPPAADERSRLLILGSMPGVASLRAHQYYGNPRNHFWPILYRLFAGREPDAAYEERLRFASEHRIALWDSIAACEREGSLDADIKNVVPNDIPGLLRRFPRIATIVCNGGKSYAELMKHHGSSPEVAERRVVKLPSTSPVPTPRYRNLEDRLEAWQVIKEFV
nr:DNA-deoxyinosine glycosylase [Cohnella sp. YIM B05605]